MAARSESRLSCDDFGLPRLGALCVVTASRPFGASTADVPPGGQFLREGHGGRDFSWKFGRSFFLWFLSRRGLLLMRLGTCVPEPAMRVSGVVEGNPGSDPGARFAPVGTVFEVDVLVLERAPQPLDENVVEETAAPVHRDADAAPFEGLR